MIRARGGQEGGRIPRLDHHLTPVDQELQRKVALTEGEGQRRNDLAAHGQIQSLTQPTTWLVGCVQNVIPAWAVISFSALALPLNPALCAKQQK